MVTASPSLDQVAQRIAEQEAALQALRREYETRKRRLDDLARRKRDLQTQLSKVDSQIQSLAGKMTPPQATKPSPATSTKSAPLFSNSGVSLPRLLETILRDGGRPLSNRELTDEVRRRKFPSQSGDLLKQVTTRVAELVRKGVFRRTKDQKAVTLVGSSMKPTPASTRSPATKTPLLKTPNRKAASTSTAKQHPEQPSLATVLTRVLQKTSKPLGGAEVAKLAQRAGYESKSKDFTNLVWVTLGKMNNVVHLKGQGYRLKRR